MLLSSRLVLLNNGSVLTTNDSTGSLHGSSCQILSVSVRPKGVLDHLNSMTTTMQARLTQRGGRTTLTFRLSDGHDDTFGTGCRSFDADGLLVDESVVFEGVDCSEVVGFLRQRQTLTLLQETRVLTDD